jgi:hypothetical protein
MDALGAPHVGERSEGRQLGLPSASRRGLRTSSHTAFNTTDEFSMLPDWLAAGMPKLIWAAKAEDVSRTHFRHSYLSMAYRSVRCRFAVFKNQMIWFPSGAIRDNIVNT